MAAKEAVILMKGQKNVAEEADVNIQIILKSSANHTPIRSMKATNIQFSIPLHTFFFFFFSK